MGVDEEMPEKWFHIYQYSDTRYRVPHRLRLSTFANDVSPLRFGRFSTIIISLEET